MSLRSDFQEKYPQFLLSHEHRNESKCEDRNGDKLGTKKIAAGSCAERVQLILSAISNDPCTTIRALVEDLGIPKNTIFRIRRELQEDGIIKREGPTKKGRWVVL